MSRMFCPILLRPFPLSPSLPSPSLPILLHRPGCDCLQARWSGVGGSFAFFHLLVCFFVFALGFFALLALPVSFVFLV